jgi:hypothetical protein
MQQLPSTGSVQLFEDYLTHLLRLPDGQQIRDYYVEAGYVTETLTIIVHRQNAVSQGALVERLS